VVGSTSTSKREELDLCMFGPRKKRWSFDKRMEGWSTTRRETRGESINHHDGKRDAKESVLFYSM